MKASLIASALVRDRVKLIGFIWAMVRDHHVAEDVFQEVAELAVRKSDEIADEHHLVRWARKTARFKTLEVLRDKHRLTQSLDGEMLETEWAIVDAREVDEDVDHLRACVEELSPRAEQIVRLRYMKGVPSAKVADTLRITLPSAYVAVARVHRALEACIRRRLQAEGSNA